MASSITAVFKATFGSLVNKKRPTNKTDKAADELRKEHVTHRKFYSFVVRKLDGFARKDRLESITFLKEGIVILQQVFKKTVTTGKDDLGGFQSKALLLATCSEIVSLVKRLNDLRQGVLDELSKEALSDAKRRFQDARKKATEEFNNEALKISDRILAMAVLVMGTILERADNPANALAASRACLEELHALPAVQKCFGIKPMKHFKFWSKNDSRRQIVATVYHLNCFLDDVMQSVGSASKNNGNSVWPYVDFEAVYVVPARHPGGTPQNNLDVTLCLKDTKKVFDYIRFRFTPGKDTPEGVAMELVAAGLISEREFAVVAFNLRKAMNTPAGRKSMVFPLESSGNLNEFTENRARNGFAKLTVNRPKARQSQ